MHWLVVQPEPDEGLQVATPLQWVERGAPGWVF
jgi:hypothetical protein